MENEECILNDDGGFCNILALVNGSSEENVPFLPTTKSPFLYFTVLLGRSATIHGLSGFDLFTFLIRFPKESYP